MKHTALAFIVIMASFISACSKSSTSTPTTPTPTPAPTVTDTRIISLTGAFSFSAVTVGTTATGTLTVHNTGTRLLSISAIALPDGFSKGIASSVVSSGGTTDIPIAFTPMALQGYSGTITVSGDQTSGTNTIAISGQGVVPAGAELLRGTISAGDPLCVYGLPPFTRTSGFCKVFDLTFHTSGRVDATLTWPDAGGLMDLEMYDPTAGSMLLRGDFQFDDVGPNDHSTLSTNINPGHFQFYARAFSLSKITDFIIVTTHPN